MNIADLKVICRFEFDEFVVFFKQSEFDPKPDGSLFIPNVFDGVQVRFGPPI